MAKTDKKLTKSLRARGVRRSVADEMARALHGRAKPRTAHRALAELSSVVEEMQDRLRGGPEKRSAAAKKAARTRKLKAQKRVRAAKRGARSRARG